MDEIKKIISMSLDTEAKWIQTRKTIQDLAAKCADVGDLDKQKMLCRMIEGVDETFKEIIKFASEIQGAPDDQ
jgi:hypothetical protein